METDNSVTSNSTTDEGIRPVESDGVVKRRRIGFFLLAVGAFLCVFGFLIALFLLQHEVNFNFALYGATGLGGTLMFGGLVAILA